MLRLTLALIVLVCGLLIVDRAMATEVWRMKCGLVSITKSLNKEYVDMRVEFHRDPLSDGSYHAYLAVYVKEGGFPVGVNIIGADKKTPFYFTTFAGSSISVASDFSMATAKGGFYNEATSEVHGQVQIVAKNCYLDEKFETR